MIVFIFKSIPALMLFLFAMNSHGFDMYDSYYLGYPAFNTEAPLFRSSHYEIMAAIKPNAILLRREEQINITVCNYVYIL